MKLPQVSERFFFEDECHLTWGDACGYVWGARNRRIKIPIINERSRKSYFGALNILTGRAVVRECENTKSDSVVNFLKYLLRRNPGKKITLFWDGVSSHRSNLVKEFLHRVNKGKKGLQARLLLIRLAPNAPEENPIEDVWLQGKSHIRKEIDYKTFSDVQNSFVKCIRNKKYKFSKIKKYRKYYE